MKLLLYCFICFNMLQAKEMTATYKVDGMMCGKSCPMKLKNSLNGIDGIKSCNVNYELKTATVVYDDEKINKDKIASTIEGETYYKCSDSSKKKRSLFGWLFGNS